MNQTVTSIDLARLRDLLAPLFPGLMGIEVTALTPERVVATMTVRPDLCTTGGILHGGALMAFADTLGGVGTFVNLPREGKRTTTTDSSTKFIGGARAGSADTTITSCSGSAYGSGRNSTVFTTLNIAVLAPMPIASVDNTSAVKPGLRRISRSA